MKALPSILNVLLLLSLLATPVLSEPTPCTQDVYSVTGASISAPFPVGSGWQYEIVNPHKIIFSSTNSERGQTFAAFLHAHELIKANNDIEFLAHVTKFRGVESGGQRFETIYNREYISYEKGTKCVRYRTKLKDFGAKDLPNGHSFLIVENIGLICQHPEDNAIGITFSIYERSTDMDVGDSFEIMALKYIDSGRFDKLTK